MPSFLSRLGEKTPNRAAVSSYSGRHHYNSRGARRQRGQFGKPVSVAAIMGNKRGRLLGTGMWHAETHSRAFAGGLLAPIMRNWT